MTVVKSKPRAAAVAQPAVVLPLVSRGAVIGAACAIVAGAWIVAGSLGLMGHALRHALGWVAVVAALASGWRVAGQPVNRIAVSVLGLVVAAFMLASTSAPVNTLGVAIVGLVIAASLEGAARDVISAASCGAAMLALWRHLYDAIPPILQLADTLGRWLGNEGAMLGGKPMWLGASFAGIDFLIVMGSLLAAAALAMPASRRIVIVGYGIIGIAGAQLIYLWTLDWLPSWIGHPPPYVAPAIGSAPIGQAPPLTWQQIGAYLVPWNLPVMLALLQLVVSAFVFRSLFNEPAVAVAPNRHIRRPMAPAVIALAAAALLPMCDSFWPSTATLEKKKIVFWEKGFLNWMKPEHGQYGRLGGGMYGMLCPFLRTLGADAIVSPDLSDADVRDASVVMLLFPDAKNPLSPEQLDRLEKFTKNGGTLAVIGDHTQHDGMDKFTTASTQPGAKPDDVPVLPVGHKPDNEFNKMLSRVSDMYVAFDSALFQVGGWLQSYEMIAHPTTIGMRDDRNQFGVVIGASVVAPWPAQPFIVGRWGTAEPGEVGSDHAMMGDRLYDPGEKLGDIVCAAEERCGKGRVIAFGDTSSFTNGVNVGAHVYTGRLFAYLANGGDVARPGWRQIFALACAGGLLWGFWREKSIAVRGASLAVLGTSIFLCTSISYASAQIYPDGNRVSPNNVAYIEASNLELKSEEGWRPDGIAGLALTLMRNGYVTMNLPEITQDRLEHAGLVVSIAPQRPFTYAEREAIKSFIENGGNFILTAGWGDHEAAAPLLKELQLWVGEDPDHPGERPPVPMGHFKSPYVDAGGYMAHVRYNAAWPVGSTDKDARVIAYGTGNVPVIIMRSVGKGKVMLVGDTGFAMNKNLEWEGGEPFDGMRENADFWRWLITVLKNETMWLPPNPNAPKSDAGARSTGGAGAPMAPPPVIPMPRFSPLLGPSRPMIPATRSLVVAPATQGANDSGSARPPVATPSTNPSTRGAQ